jgi:hypothetical protein
VADYVTVIDLLEFNVSSLSKILPHRLQRYSLEEAERLGFEAAAVILNYL